MAVPIPIKTARHPTLAPVVNSDAVPPRQFPTLHMTNEQKLEYRASLASIESGQVPTDRSQTKSVEAICVALSNEPQTVVQIARASGRSTSTVNNAMAKLITNGVAQAAGRLNNRNKTRLIVRGPKWENLNEEVNK